MGRERLIELVLGWLAAILDGAVAAYIYFGGFIAPDSVQRDLIGFGALLLALVVGVTLDSVFDVLIGRLLLAVATLLLAVISLTSFIAFLLPAVPLTVGATMLAFFRPRVHAAKAASG